MSTPKHTPGPWTVVDLTTDVENGQLRIDSDGGCIADCGRGRFVDDESRANAARIVACVNACEGIKDPSVVPELLRIVMRLREGNPLHQDCGDNRERCVVCAAIYRATGAA